ncbi:MAG: thioesterase family protein [Bacteroidota bacterium]|nr:acyl-CoA thioesterase [Candidatus Kapabacteria bacterium]MDW8221194.1 thioesterase family protein [Bacteroidota bacterium]
MSIHEHPSITHCTHVRVRYADTDKMKIVYNGAYLIYFEVGRTELLRACGLPYRELEQAGYLLPVLEAFIRYKTPAVYDDVLDIYATYVLQRSATVRIEYCIKRGEIEIVDGYTLHAFVSAEAMKPVRPPSLFFDAMEKACVLRSQMAGSGDGDVCSKVGGY